MVRQAGVFRKKQNINLLLGHRAEKIDSARQVVYGTTREGHPFEYPYDSLLIATGSAPIRPDLPGFDLPGVEVLRSLEDGRRLKRILSDNRDIKRAVIIGMGYIALEACEALTNLGIGIDMVKPGPRFLPWLKEEMAREVRADIEGRGVGVHTGHLIEHIESCEKGLRVICADLVLSCDLIIVAIGTTPNSRIGAEAGLALGVRKAISVDHHLRTSIKNIYAAGDCADAYHIVTGRKTWVPLGLLANRAGRVVADNICGKNVRLEGVVGSSVLRVFDFEVARTGLTFSEAEEFGLEPVESMIKSPSRGHAQPGSSTIWVNMVAQKKSGRLLGVQMIGKEGVAHRINCPAVALFSHMSVEQYSQTDLAYTPPFGPTWDPTLTAANQLLKMLSQ